MKIIQLTLRSQQIELKTQVLFFLTIKKNTSSEYNLLRTCLVFNCKHIFESKNTYTHKKLYNYFRFKRTFVSSKYINQRYVYQLLHIFFVKKDSFWYIPR